MQQNEQLICCRESHIQMVVWLAWFGLPGWFVGVCLLIIIIGNFSLMTAVCLFSLVLFMVALLMMIIIIMVMMMMMMMIIRLLVCQLLTDIWCWTEEEGNFSFEMILWGQQWQQ